MPDPIPYQSKKPDPTFVSNYDKARRNEIPRLTKRTFAFSTLIFLATLTYVILTLIFGEHPPLPDWLGAIIGFLVCFCPIICFPMTAYAASDYTDPKTRPKGGALIILSFIFTASPLFATCVILFHSPTH